MWDSKCSPLSTVPRFSQSIEVYYNLTPYRDKLYFLLYYVFLSTHMEAHTQGQITKET